MPQHPVKAEPEPKLSVPLPPSFAPWCQVGVRVGSSRAVLVQIKPGSHPVALALEQEDSGHVMQRLGLWELPV